MALLELLEPGAGQIALQAFESVLLRAIQTRLASHPNMAFARTGTANSWDFAKRVEGVLKGLGWEEQLPSHLVHEVEMMCSLGYGRGFADRRADDGTIATLLKSYRRRREELRCECCGYHFRYEDLATDTRRSLCKEAGLLLAQQIDPRRTVDAMKPDNQTELHVDHIIPRSGWGPTLVGNLQVLCAYCNLGKGFSMWAGELVPGLLGLSLTGRGRAPNPSAQAYANTEDDSLDSSWFLRRMLFYSTARHHGSICELCGGSWETRELTIQQRDAESLWTFVTGMRLVCYECA